MSATPPKLNHIYFFGAGAPPSGVDEKILGGKGHSLAQMSAAGLPVPPGFTISADCCRIYHAEKKWPAGLEQELQQAVAWLEEVTNSKLGVAPRPLLVAVRSGAAVSMPGMMDTVLNVGLSLKLEQQQGAAFWKRYRDFVRGFAQTVRNVPDEVFEKAAHGKTSHREEAESFLREFREKLGEDFPQDPKVSLRQAINAVFDSWNSERAINYRARNNVRSLTGTAVNVQSMFQSEMSGVLFTHDPNNPAAERIIIESTVGLGEALVLGHVEPDVFFLDRKTLNITEKNLVEEGRGLSLTDEQVLEVGRLGMKVEEYFKFPVDIEWGFENGKFVLLQSRRIRGLDIAADVPQARHEEIERLRKLANGRKKVWAVHNLGETLPFPTPLTWDIISHFMNRGGFVKLYKELGMKPSQRVQQDGFLELIAGRVYADVEGLAELFYGDSPLEYDLENATPESLLGEPTKFNYERAGVGFLLKLPLFLFNLYAYSKTLKRETVQCLKVFETKTVPAFMDYAWNARRKNLGSLSDEELLRELSEREKVLNDFGCETLKPGFLASYYHGRVSASYNEIFGPDKGPDILARLLRGLDGDKTVESNIALYRIATGDLTMEQFLADFGHRAVAEFELSERRWSEDNKYIQQIVDNYKRGLSDGAGKSKSPIELHEKQKHEREAAEKQLSGLLQEAGASSLEADLLADLKATQVFLPYRETGKHYFMLSLALVREVLQVLAERHDLGKDLYFLRRSELAQLKTNRDLLKKEIAQRKLRWQSQQRLNVPEVLSSDKLDLLGHHEELAKAKEGVFTGTGVAAGNGTGKARVLKSPHEAGNLGNDYVLVCPTTDPSWAPLFVNARGLIVERGGVLSHGAIVARDFGIPAVVLKDAIRLVPDGCTVKVDGSRGTIEVVNGA